ncbi:MAG: hypothetical protein AAF383_12740, partial [Cyanobacteria bacterium P01_A01_bin.83]
MGKPLIISQCGHPNDGFGQEGRAVTKNFWIKRVSFTAQIPRFSHIFPLQLQPISPEIFRSP